MKKNETTVQCPGGWNGQDTPGSIFVAKAVCLQWREILTVTPRADLCSAHLWYKHCVFCVPYPPASQIYILCPWVVLLCISCLIFTWGRLLPLPAPVCAAGSECIWFSICLYDRLGVLRGTFCPWVAFVVEGIYIAWLLYLGVSSMPGGPWLWLEAGISC